MKKLICLMMLLSIFRCAWLYGQYSPQEDFKYNGFRIAHSAPSGPNYHLIKQIVVGGEEEWWDFLTFDSKTHRLYISRQTHVVVVDVNKGVVVGDIPNTPWVHGIALIPKLNRGFTSNGGDASITVFDMKTFKEISRIKISSNPDAIIYDPSVDRIFTLNHDAKELSVINPISLKEESTVSIEGQPEFAVTDGKGNLYITSETTNEIIVCDTRSLKVINRWSLGPGEGPTGLAMDKKNHRLFAVCANEKMIVMNSDNGKVIATPIIGKSPDAAEFDPKTGLAFSSNDDGTLTVVKQETPNVYSIIANVPTQNGARTMALDTKTHKLYLVAGRYFARPAGSTATRRMEPRTFVVLEFGF